MPLGPELGIEVAPLECPKPMRTATATRCTTPSRPSGPSTRWPTSSIQGHTELFEEGPGLYSKTFDRVNERREV